MENTDTQPKQTAVDSKSAYAGDTTAEMNGAVGIDQMGKDAGLNVQPEEPLSISEKLKARDENRSELPDS
ncbi:MAG: hypothetical protein AAFU53_09150 [Cyanobacteria bacterium J06632_3]